MIEALNNATAALIQYYIQHHPQEVATDLEEEDTQAILDLLVQFEPAIAAPILLRLSPGKVASVLEHVPSGYFTKLAQHIDGVKLAIFISRMDRDTQTERLSHVSDTLAEELRMYMEYPVDSAGYIMDTQVIAFHPEEPTGLVLEKLRRHQKVKMRDIYLVDAEGKLDGIAFIGDIALADPETPIGTLSKLVPPSVHAMASQENVIEILQQADFSSMAVTDMDGYFLGVLQHSDLLNTVQEDAASDMVTMVGAGREERALSKVNLAVKKRLPWLQINLFTAFIASAVVAVFEDTIAMVTVLAILLPVIGGQSGNTGLQSLVVVMRALALREIRLKQWGRVAIKEVKVGALNGLAVALTTSLVVFIWSQSLALTGIVGASMVIAMVIAAFAGTIIPIILTAFKLDPAQSSSIILTTVTDVVGFFTFLGLASLFIHLLV
jgi:magnesium transporter